MVIGVIVIIIIAVSFINALLGTTDPDESSRLVNVFSITLSLIGGIIGIIVAILQVITWKNLYTFFIENNNMFPSYIGSYTIDGSKYLKNAMILALIGAIIGFFIGIVGMIIGIIVWILSIVGYFKLGNLRNLGVAVTPSPGMAVPAAQAAPTPVAKRFCPNCGTPVSGQEKFCSSCGSELK
jgi:hypothetical protein